MTQDREAAPRSAVPERTADLILYGGTVLTLDAMSRRAEAVAIRQGKVQAIGSTREMLQLAGQQTHLLDLQGGTAVPGFIETHSHPMLYGHRRRSCVDAGTPPNQTIGEIVERIAEWAASTPKGEWIHAEGYDDTLLRDRRHPTRWDLDRATPHHPVYLTHISGHFSVANSMALRIAGLTRESAEPHGGRLYRDASGELNGVLAEAAAQFLVSHHIPALSVHELVEDLAAASSEYLAAGVTSAHDLGIGFIGGATALQAYQRAIDQHRFLPRCYGFLAEPILTEFGGDGVPSPSRLATAERERLHLGGIKLWADGSIQGLTGALSEPYECNPETCGVEIFDRTRLTSRVAEMRAAGWQVAIHGNGDAAIGTILDAYAANGAGRADADPRYRIEHCQMAREDQLERMGALGIYPSFFVKHVYYWGDRHRDIFIGPQRARRISPLCSAQRIGLRFALHSDCPVTPIPPLEGMWSAVNRITRNGELLGPEQRIGAERALRAYTADAAYLSFEEGAKGTLEPGKLGDVTVLSGDPTRVDPAALNQLSVEATIIGGEIAWQRS
ncbi:MAG: amidohydrolase [bacterium]|nr:amidohydrolase [bacterium]